MSDISARPLSIIYEKKDSEISIGEIFYAENHQSVEQPPQICGEVPVTGGF